MTAVILDDEPYCTETLFHLCRKHCPDILSIGTFTHPDEAMASIRAQSPDILFLDVEMPFMSGFDFLKTLGSTSASVIFTTAYDTYAVEAFKVNAVDYLLKPIGKEDLVRAVSKVAAKPQPLDQNLLSNLIRSALDQHQQTRRITVHTQDGIILLSHEEIIYCKGEGSYCLIYLKDQPSVMVSKNLTEMEKMIDSPRFFRLHKSYLINGDHIIKVNKADGGDVVMSNKDLVPVSRQRRTEFFDWLS